MSENKILKIGITGGIGSGKTTVCHIFETLGIPVYYADDRAKTLMVENVDLIKNIKNLFGEAAYFPDGTLNRQHIADIAFHNPLKLSELNALVHPAVWLDGEAWQKAQTTAPYTLKEAALLFESGGNLLLDKIITVVAPEETRIERVLLRSQIPISRGGGGTMKRTDVEARIAKQMPDEEKIKQSDFVIWNDGSQALIPQVMAIHEAIIEQA